MVLEDGSRATAARGRIISLRALTPVTELFVKKRRQGRRQAGGAGKRVRSRAGKRAGSRAGRRAGQAGGHGGRGRAGLGREKSEIRTNKLIHFCSGIAIINKHTSTLLAGFERAKILDAFLPGFEKTTVAQRRRAYDLLASGL